MNDYEKFQELLDCCLAEALENALMPNDDVMFKSFCRAYSTKFCTPLHLVYTLDPKEVVQTMLDDRYVGSDVVSNLEDILEQIYTLEDPEYKKQKEVDMGDFIQAAQERESKRIKRNKEAAKIESLKPPEPPKPTQGGFDAGKLNLKNEG